MPSNDDVSPQEFLDAIFEDQTDDENVCLSYSNKSGGFINVLEEDRAWVRRDKHKVPLSWYYVVSTIGDGINASGSMPSRGRANLIRYHVIVLDDIGTKAEAPSLDPTYKLESSEDNFQWGYRIAPGDNFPLYEAYVSWLGEQGYSDLGAGGSYRLVRVPGSRNAKEGKNGFISRIPREDWHPDRVWTLEELAAAFDCDLTKLEIKTTTHKSAREGGAEAMEGIDPLLDWLADSKNIIEDNGSQWVKVICPWAEAHTSGDNAAGYSPLGRGDGDWVQTRAFKCLHEHCVDKKNKDFFKWSRALGAPEVSGFDPLPWLQKRFVFVNTPIGYMADTIQLPHGGQWLYTKDQFNVLTKDAKVQLNDKLVPAWTAMIAHANTRVVETHAYIPGKNLIIDMKGQDILNTYHAPLHPPTTRTPERFLKHIDYLCPLPHEADLVLDWLAWKIQNPGGRSYSLIMVSKGYGIGRTFLSRVLHKVTQGATREVSLKEIMGKGSVWTGWATGVQFIIVPEARDVDQKDFWRGYETIKERIDTNPVPFECNEKFQPVRTEYMYFNTLVLSNHADAINLPEGDRRFCVITNPDTAQSQEYYDELYGSIDEEAGAIYHYLMTRDVSAFQSKMPPVTQGKIDMIDMGRSPAEEVKEMIVEGHWSDLTTQAMLMSEVVRCARIVGDEKLASSPGPVTRHIWKELGSLRPGKKNGCRIRVEGAVREVRALRNYDHWLQEICEQNLESVSKALTKHVIKNENA